MTTILLVRHGHVEGIDPLRFRGQHPLPLTERGYEEAGLTARRIASAWHPSAVCTSPLERCVVTGARTAGLFGLEPVISEGLQDLNYGEWQWKTYEEVRERWPRLYGLWRTAPHLVRFPGGDSLQDIVLRTADVFRQMTEAFPDDTVVLVGHDSVNRALLLQLLDQPLSAYWKLAQDPCCINVIEFRKDVVRVVSVNDTSHLR
ncbi:Phosphoglyceromutase OS=Afipia felis OX=1035 GN=NCTC12722_02926 PE=4 SV=1 [Afipia felis]